MNDKWDLFHLFEREIRLIVVKRLYECNKLIEVVHGCSWCLLPFPRGKSRNSLIQFRYQHCSLMNSSCLHCSVRTNHQWWSVLMMTVMACWTVVMTMIRIHVRFGHYLLMEMDQCYVAHFSFSPSSVHVSNEILFYWVVWFDHHFWLLAFRKQIRRHHKMIRCWWNYWICINIMFRVIFFIVITIVIAFPKNHTQISRISSNWFSAAQLISTTMNS